MKSFEKIIGYESIKNQLYQIIDMFKNKELYEKMGAKLSKGVLIYGNPGLGKTMLAEALIKECAVKTFIIKNNKDQRTLIKEINDAFVEASKLERAIIFLDDLDKFTESDGENVDAKLFVNIQTNIDSVKDKEILVVATANNIKKLPDSLKRNGRFDNKISVESPTNDDAAEIIKYYLKSRNVNENLNYEDVSKMISYTSCADLETILNESAIYAAYSRKNSIDMNDIIKAYCHDYYSTPCDNFECSDEEIYATSLHEAGHAVIAEVLKKGSVGCISIYPTQMGFATGFTKLCEKFIRRPENVLIGLGGKVACELFYQGKCASNCYSDLDKVIKLIRNGMFENGTCGIGLIEVTRNSSESMITRGEAVIQAEIERYMFRTKDILLKNREFVLKLANEIAEKKFLLYSDIEKIRESVQIEYVQID